MLLEHLFDLVEEDAGLGLGWLLVVVLPLSGSTEENFAFGKKGSQGTGESGNAGTSPEESTPSSVRDEVQVDDCGDEVTCCITLLQDTAGETTSLYGKVFKSGGGG